MRLLGIFLFSFLSITIFSQQWVETKYSYDSIMNLTYGSSIDFAGDLVNHKMNIYLPKCGDGSKKYVKPLIMFIHGGAFLAGNKDEQNIVHLCKQFAKRGYVTATISYRLGFISDDAAWSCVYQNYSCVFASDSSEWSRAYYRAVQDAKGALRFLINRNAEYQIDVNNVFVSGESAGSFLALGTALLDSESERLPDTYTLPDAPAPNTNTSSCIYRVNKVLNKPIARPDLGSIDGSIEPTSIDFTIQGIGNMYGAMLNDLLKIHNSNKPKPAIYSFHQPCDLVVPIDSGVVYQGLSWCFTNGYNCYGIQNNNKKLYGSRAISNLNQENNYGYQIHNEFTSTNFPYNFLIGQGSCIDQVNNPCHAYDNFGLREMNLARFFAQLIQNNNGCTENTQVENISPIEDCISISTEINSDKILIHNYCHSDFRIQILSLEQKLVNQFTAYSKSLIEVNTSEYNTGIYVIIIVDPSGPVVAKRIFIQ
ncbi:MAG: alpha/beta hydrolase [Saprospiraceae bacterium]|nr:alpha/beta hydrolase [Saprospiraceae bacterium]